MLALTRNDVDFVGQIISVNKSYQHIEGQDIVTEPKTPKSNRIVAIPKFLCSELKEYFEKLYQNSPESRIFSVAKHFLMKEITKGSKAGGVQRIRVHDLRHSHASLLIEMGFSPLLIADRLDHENIETTLNTYGHLYHN